MEDALMTTNRNDPAKPMSKKDVAMAVGGFAVAAAASKAAATIHLR